MTETDDLPITAVRTTAIFCRPGCSGRPLVKNCVRYATTRDALAAGYRACLRCRPLEWVPAA